MKISDTLLRKMETDLGLNSPFIRNARIPVSNCWHFCTDGNAVDTMFYDKQDFIDGMNRIYQVSLKFRIVLLAHVLMDTHLHFVIYGEHPACNAFVHEYIRLTSMHIAHRHKQSKKLKNIPVRCQRINDDQYLKTAICYVIKNPTAAGLRFMPTDYPWSSGALYFKRDGFWTSPVWIQRKSDDTPTADGLVFPGDYTAFEMVERIFKTCRSFSYFLGMTREEDMNSVALIASRMSIPIQEMRQHRDEAIRELFGMKNSKSLDMIQRIKLARTLRARYGCSPKLIARLCGLIYEEVREQIA